MQIRLAYYTKPHDPNEHAKANQSPTLHNTTPNMRIKQYHNTKSPKLIHSTRQ